jgi:hypothetical protein
VHAPSAAKVSEVLCSKFKDDESHRKLTSALADGFEWDDDRNMCMSTADDVDSCGPFRWPCYAPNHGSATCSTGSCSWSCDAGYRKFLLICIKDGKGYGASARARVRAKRLIPENKLCSLGETGE